MNSGCNIWVVSGGHIPDRNNGVEPEFTSRDTLCLLNINQVEASVEITIYHNDKQPVGPYKLTAKPERTKHIRVNDLIDPEPVFLDHDYSAVIKSDIPIVVQFSRMNTCQTALSIFSTMAYAEDIKVMI